ncbi:DNase I-like protein [Rhizodiscina lignyota]|uniref:DNA-(apurinic or apyrimidinic site) endonuclease 2 n=1 Tax=Rhizodiscina lignyota TaxID=1504668 RepID=A0A9P4IS65_9PEZI|nr:DNase I-like protein [Rhizodiscina lignyota]
MGFRITTWNVNGIRNPFGYQPWRDKRTFEGMFDLLEADIVIMQELKIQRKDLTDDMVLVPGWDCYFSLPKQKKGYSGVGIYTRQSTCTPIRAEEGILGVLCPPGSSTPYRFLPADQTIGGYPTLEQVETLGVDPAALDAEGRCVILEFPAFVLFGIYSPANSNGMRDDFRFGFLRALDARIRNLTSSGKRVIVTGDLNVSRSELDTANAEETLKKEGLTHEDYISTPNRRIFNQLLEGGDVVGSRDEGREFPVLWDTCRGFHPTRKGMYTHWEQKINARPANYGSRIDYVLCSISMKDWVQDANIQEGLMGSDHCPVYIILKDRVPLNEMDVELRSILHPPGHFVDGKRIREAALKDLPTLSARLMPEFDKRRSIKDMFSRKRKATDDSQETILNDIPTASQGTDDAANRTTSNSISSTPTPDHAIHLQAPSTVSPLPQPSQPVRSAAEPPKAKESPSKDNQQPNKRTKSSAPKTVQRQGSTRGQQSLKGFFKPTLRTPEQENDVRTESDIKLSSREGDIVKTKSAVSINGKNNRPTVAASAENGYYLASTVIDAVASKESWDKLFAKRAAPLCEGHSEPCITLLSKKKGFNCGRSFWICPRPLGPSGNKEVGTQWRCRTFIWSSDWNGNG